MSVDELGNGEASTGIEVGKGERRWTSEEGRGRKWRRATGASMSASGKGIGFAVTTLAESRRLVDQCYVASC
jgi:hypothetical protein